MSFCEATLIFVSNRVIHSLNSTWLNTSGMAVNSPSAVAKRASPIFLEWPPISRAPPCLDWSPRASNVLIIEMTVKNSPTIVAILATARIGASRKWSRGRISSSVALAMLRFIAAVPCSDASSPATKS